LIWLAKWRVKDKLNELIPNLDSTEQILDIGSGNGVLCNELRKHNFNVVPLDVNDFSLIDEVKPVIYNAPKIPFSDSAFDVALLITVLHHTRQPEQVLGEAKRVAKQIIVIEEIYSNAFDKYITYFIDSIFNCEFFVHPHTNMTDAGWRKVFDLLRLKITHVRYYRSLLVLKRVTYVLKVSNQSTNTTENRDRAKEK
jgi:ubiquinone/menaquinone biosynthesis C-methylase UbiE